MTFDATFHAAVEPLAAPRRSDRDLAPLPPRAAHWFGPRDVSRHNQPPAALAPRRKRLVVCADGTWNTPRQTQHGKPAPTNVWLLYQLIAPAASDGTPQLAYYHPGIGTGGPLNRILGGAFGVGIKGNILDCYRFLVDHYRAGDALYLFGFSRGAYTARSLAGLIRNCGILDREKAGPPCAALIEDAYRLYRGRGDDTAPAADRSVDFRARHSHPDFKITCIGVWDTVGALGIPVGFAGRMSKYIFGFHDVTLSSWVQRGFHAVAVDERRRPFVPTLWVQQLGAAAAGQHVEQVWFAGDHSDVGGGYAEDERGLASATLRWMVNRVTAYCGLELDAGPLLRRPPGEVALHDSLTWWYRLVDLARGPFLRYIDRGLGETGRRDPLGRQCEALHDSVELLRQEFASRPMPVVDRRYAPVNVADYEARLEKARQLPPGGRGADSWDTKPGPAGTLRG